jgi:hypothetical protein
MEFVFRVVLLCGAPAWGAAIAGVVLAVWRFIHNLRGFPEQAGHWLLVILGTLTMGGGLVALLEDSDPNPDAFTAVVVLGLVVLLPLEIGFAAWNSQSKHWRFALLSVVIGWLGMMIGFAAVASSHSNPYSAAPSLVVLGMLGMCVAIGLPPIAFVGAILIDLIRRERRDVLHWTGVATLAAIAAQPLAMFAIESLSHRLR